MKITNVKPSSSNNSMRRNKILGLFIFVALLGIGSCKKDFLDKKPISDVTEGNFFQTGADAESAIIAAYSNFQSEYYVFDYYIKLMMIKCMSSLVLSNSPTFSFLASKSIL